MYFGRILWLLAWPTMIAASYYLTLWALKLLDKQIKEEPPGGDPLP